MHKNWILYLQIQKKSRTLKPHILTLKLVKKLDLRFGEKVIAL